MVGLKEGGDALLTMIDYDDSETYGLMECRKWFRNLHQWVDDITFTRCAFICEFDQAPTACGAVQKYRCVTYL